MSESGNEHSPIEPAVGGRRAWVKGTLLGVALLVMGGVIGSSLTVMAIKQQADRDRRERPNMPTRLVERLTREMDLSHEQTQQVEVIVSKRAGAIRRLHEEMRPLAQQEMRAMKEEIASILTPEQRAYWDRRWEEQSEKMRRRREQERERRGAGLSDSDRRRRDDWKERGDSRPPDEGSP